MSLEYMNTMTNGQMLSSMPDDKMTNVLCWALWECIRVVHIKSL